MGKGCIMSISQIMSFLFFTFLVAFITWRKVKKDNLNSEDGFFLAGRSLTAPVIAGTLLLTNLSSEQLVGQAGQSYSANLSVIGWEVIAALALIFMATIFLPKYLERGLTTIPQFIEERYDSTTSLIVNICLLVATGICFLPVVLYSGALAITQLFNVSEIFGWSQEGAVIVLVVTLGIIGAIYALGGGLKAVAISDTINGIGLLVGGLMIPLFGLAYIGDGSILEGFRYIAHNHPEKLNVIGSSSDPVPIGTVFTGMILVNTFYWCTNQGIVQRTFAAKSLAEGQKGVIITAFLKMLVPFILVFPGVIAYAINPNLPYADLAYPVLISKVLPLTLVGFFGAVLFGAILSSFNSFLNSAATLYSFGIHNKYINKNADHSSHIKVSRIFGIIVTIVSVIIAPLIAYAPQGLFAWMKGLNAIYNVPLVTIIVIGFFFPRVPALAGKVGMLLGISGYLLIRYVIQLPIHFLHAVSIMCVINVIVMLIISKVKPRDVPFKFKNAGVVDLKAWPQLKYAVVSILAMIIAIYSWLAIFGGYNSVVIAIISTVVGIIFFILMLFKKSNKNS